MRCKQCGAEIPVGISYCTKCGCRTAYVQPGENGNNHQYRQPVNNPVSGNTNYRERQAPSAPANAYRSVGTAPRQGHVTTGKTHSRVSQNSDDTQASFNELNHAIKGVTKSVSSKVATTLGKKNNKTLILVAAGALAFIVLLIIALLIIVINIHHCEECDKIYFGKQYTISFFGETEKVCKDCYKDFYLY